MPGHLQIPQIVYTFASALRNLWRDELAYIAYYIIKL
jgi:hypothetical protein